MGISSALTNTKDFTKSLWLDPYRWSIVKSVSLFLGAIFIAKAFEEAEAEEIAETAAKLAAAS